jgi:hypothetical protein
MSSPYPARLAFRQALTALVLNLVTMPLGWLSVRSASGPPLWPFLLSWAFSLALLMFVLQRSRRPSIPQASVAFLLNNVAITVALWFMNAQDASAWPGRILFQPNNLGVLATATLAPGSPSFGLLSMAMFAGSALFQLFTLPEAVRDRVAHGEVWAVLMFTVFSVVILFGRLRSERLRDQLARSHAEGALLAQTSKRFLALRDLANTPLQTLEATATLLERIPDARAHAERTHRALTRLRDWQTVIMKESEKLTWDLEHVSFDPRKVLHEPP